MGKEDTGKWGRWGIDGTCADRSH
ncbi:uncharacterized protein G2W53_018462 [Senna tora]|uniref:Uncharacterized protein n=1 Tax=Senna tora TaxID=362788 RepID=A0A834WNE0_9FABA|nr:uncharacterized protein G2W53_018462 [Senna tora]